MPAGSRHFSRILQRPPHLLQFIYGPTHNVERDTRRILLSEEAHFSTRSCSVFGPYLFAPITGFVRRLSTAVSALQSGYLNSYNAMIGILLVSFWPCRCFTSENLMFEQDFGRVSRNGSSTQAFDARSNGASADAELHMISIAEDVPRQAELIAEVKGCNAARRFSLLSAREPSETSSRPPLGFTPLCRDRWPKGRSDR